MRRLIVATLLAVAVWQPYIHGEENPFAWTGHEVVARRLSDAAVWTQIGAETVHAWRAEDRKRAFTCEAMRVGITIGVAEATKHLVHRTRPDGSDQMSFYSEHTALAFATSGWRFKVGIPVAIGTGYLRMAANRHYLSDVLVGAGAGSLTRLFCR